MKQIIIVSVILLITVCIAQKHNYFWGQILWNNQRYSYNVAEKKPFLSWSVQKKDFKFPQPVSNGQIYNYRNITAINVTDNAVNGTGGFVRLRAGGVGQNYTVLRCESQKGQGFNFTIDIYTT